MERDIGVDAHASSCTLAVVGSSGKRLGSLVVETNARVADRGAARDRAGSALRTSDDMIDLWIYYTIHL